MKKLALVLAIVLVAVFAVVGCTKVDNTGNTNSTQSEQNGGNDNTNSQNGGNNTNSQNGGNNNTNSQDGGNNTNSQNGGQQGGNTQTGTNAFFTADDITAGTYSTNTAINSVFTMVANSEKSIVVEDGQSEHTCGSYTVTSRLKMAGKIAIGTVPAKNCVMFTTTGACTLTVYAKSSSSSGTDRTGTVLNATGAEVATSAQPFPTSGTTLSPYTFSIPSAGTYYFGSTVNGLNVYAMTLTY